MPITVRGGAFCAPEGATGTTSAGNPVTCAPAAGGRNRWQSPSAGGSGLLASAAAGDDAKRIRRALLNKLRALGVKLPKRGLPNEEVQKLIDAEEARLKDEQTYQDIDRAFPAEEVRGLPDAPPANDWPLPGEKQPPAEEDTEPVVVPPEPPVPAGPKVTVGEAKPLSENLWGSVIGGVPDGAICYHDHGEIGRTVTDLGRGAQVVHVDGKPLGDVLGRIATDTVVLKTHPAEQVEQVRKLAEALPEGNAKRMVSYLADALDAPPRPLPAFPEATPAPIRRLAEQLNEIPLVRRDGKEIDALKELADRFADGKTGGRSLLREVRQAALNRRHESMEGKLAVDDLVVKALKDLEGMSYDSLYHRN